ncbi:MAG: hypothetical protein A2189_06335 [Paenibacillus sp. RIFOXYA1_FULL_44_5]|nr:MAG: hypothetical protein A2189_06335 [Paenibacillus sp. RIFOXYA1_FULL_44_5]
MIRMLGMRKKWLGILLIGSMMLLTGCTSYDSLNSPSLSTFRKDMLAEFPNLDKKISVRMAPTQLEFIYTLKAQANAENKLDIVRQTSRYINGSSFQKEIIDGIYFDKYSKQDHKYPNISVSIDTDRDGSANFEYRADFAQGGYVSWWFTDYKNAPIPVKLE